MNEPVTLIDFPGLRARDNAEPGFARELVKTAQALGLDPNGLAAVISFESGVNPAAKNPSSGATGLIQFMPRTASGLGTSTAQLSRMSAVEQLPFVRKFYSPLARSLRSVPGDYYMAVFMPAFVGTAPETVLGRAGNPIYDQNKGLDIDADGTLTVGDVTRKITQFYQTHDARPRATFTSEKKTPSPSAPSQPPPSPASSSGKPCGSGAAKP